jgi:hypothetical protein
MEDFSSHVKYVAVYHSIKLALLLPVAMKNLNIGMFVGFNYL